MGADLEHRADPVRRAVDRARGRSDPGGGRDVAPPAERPAPRCGRGGAGGDSDRDAVRAISPWALAHEARGHEGGAPRVVGACARSARREDDLLVRGRVAPLMYTRTRAREPGWEGDRDGTRWD